MQHYVVGLFVVGDKTLMVEKSRGPDAVVGKLNGIGGKCGIGEMPLGCMEREFAEETGKVVYAYQWKGCGKLVNENWVVHFFIHHGEMFEQPETNDVGERLHWVVWNDFPSRIVVPNLRWILSLIHI